MILSLLMALVSAQEQELLGRLNSDDLEGVRRLVEARPDLVKKSEVKGRFPLSWASSEEMIEFLISKGADPNARDKEGKTALFYLLQHPKKELTEALLRHGAYPNESRGGNALLVRMALSYRSEEKALLLLQQDCPYEEGKDIPSNLYLASQLGMTTVVKKLLDLRVKVDVPGPHGFTALHIALAGSHDAAARLLIDAGADVNAQTPAIPDFIGGINRSYNGMRTPLLLACSSGMAGTVRVLLKKGARIDARDQFGLTPLHHAARVQDVDLVRMLLEHKADVNAGKTSSPRTAKLLVETLEDRGQAGWPYGSPLHLAAEGGSRTLVEILLQSKADVHVRDGRGRTALHRLLDPLEYSPGLGLFEHSWPLVFPSTCSEKWMKGDRDEVLKALIQAGADVNAKDADGVTPLKLAVDLKNVNAAKLLRGSGAKE